MILELLGIRRPEKETAELRQRLINKIDEYRQKIYNPTPEERCVRNVETLMQSLNKGEMERAIDTRAEALINMDKRSCYLDTELMLFGSPVKFYVEFDGKQKEPRTK